MPLLTFSDVSRGDKEHLPAHVDPHRVGVAIAVEVARDGRVEATTCSEILLQIMFLNDPPFFEHRKWKRMTANQKFW